MASPHNDFNEPGTFYAGANQSKQIISRERSGSVNSPTSGQSFGSAASVFSVKRGTGLLSVGDTYHIPVSHEPAVNFA